MTRSRSKELADFNPELERTILRFRRKDKNKIESSSANIREELLEEEMADPADFRAQVENQRERIQELNQENLNVDPMNIQVADNRGIRNPEPPRTNSDFARPNLVGVNSSIVRPRVEANNFELKLGVIQMVQQYAQFDGLQDEDPNTHIQLFLEICDTFKFNGVSEDAVRLRLFPFSLRGKAKQWLNSLPRNSITTWQELIKKFMDKFFPPSKTAKLRAEIQSYHQYEMETLYETWERFKESMGK